MTSQIHKDFSTRLGLFDQDCVEIHMNFLQVPALNFDPLSRLFQDSVKIRSDYPGSAVNFDYLSRLSPHRVFPVNFHILGQ